MVDLADSPGKGSRRSSFCSDATLEDFANSPAKSTRRSSLCSIVDAQLGGDGREGLYSMDSLGRTRRRSLCSAVESETGGCRASPTGNHFWRYGKCTYCGDPEGLLLDKGKGNLCNPGNPNKCPAGGKCMYKFGECIKCGQGEAGLKSRSASRDSESGSSATESTVDMPGGHVRRRSVTMFTPGSAMESESGQCSLSPTGMHHWRYGRCVHCDRAEGLILNKGPGAVQNPGGWSRDVCSHGGKCVFKFAQCTKCGKGEAGVKPRDRSVSRQSSRESLHSDGPRKSEGRAKRSPKRSPGARRVMSESQSVPNFAVAGPPSGACKMSPSGMHYWKFGKCTYCHQAEGNQMTLHMRLASEYDALYLKPGGTPRSPSRPGDSPVSSTTDEGIDELSRSVPSRLLGRRSSHTAGSAMESESGECKASPTGMHHWKYGYCLHCGQAEGKLLAGAGAVQNPGLLDECPQGGKCMYKFAQCTKCGKGEAGVRRSSSKDIALLTNLPAEAFTKNTKSKFTPQASPTSTEAITPPSKYTPSTSPRSTTKDSSSTYFPFPGEAFTPTKMNVYMPNSSPRSTIPNSSPMSSPTRSTIPNSSPMSSPRSTIGGSETPMKFLRGSKQGSTRRGAPSRSPAASPRPYPVPSGRSAYARGKSQRAWQAPPSAKGRTTYMDPFAVPCGEQPAGVFAHMGALYISESVDDQVVCIKDGERTVVAGGNGKGSRPDQLDRPFRIFVNEDGIYIADRNNARVQFWRHGAAAGETVAGGNGPGHGHHQLNQPAGLVVTSDHLYIADRANHRVMRWSPGADEGVLVAGGNGVGRGPGQIGCPGAICLRGSALYISDEAGARVQRWVLGESYGTTVAGGRGNGSSAKQLYHPAGITLMDQSLVICDATNHRVQRVELRPHGGDCAAKTICGGFGFTSGPGHLGFCVDCFWDGEQLYVSDWYHSCVRTYTRGVLEHHAGLPIAAQAHAECDALRRTGRVMEWRDHPGYGWIADDRTGHRFMAQKADISNSLVRFGYNVLTVGEKVEYFLVRDITGLWRCDAITAPGGGPVSTEHEVVDMSVNSGTRQRRTISGRYHQLGHGSFFDGPTKANISPELGSSDNPAFGA